MKPSRRLTFFALLLTLLSLVFVLSACGGASASSTVALPQFVQNAPHNVQIAYRYAIDHPEMLANQPCYCGCGVMNHTSNLHCYIRDIDREGRIAFDTHAIGCGICVDITLDVMRLSEEGLTPLQIRQYVDAKYSPFGPSTDTPMPEV